MALAGNICLGVYALYLDRASRVNRAFALLCFSLSFWVLGAAIQGFSSSPDWASNALFGIRIVYTGVVFIFLSFFYFTRLFPTDRSEVLRSRAAVSLILMVSLVTLAFIWTGDFVSQAVTGRYGYFEKAGSLYPLIYLIVGGIVLLFLDLGFLYCTCSSDLDRRRLHYILAGGALPLILGSLNVFFIATGRLNNPYFILPLAPLSTMVSAMLYYYGITRYKILSFAHVFEASSSEEGHYNLSHENIYVLREEHREKTTSVLTDLVSQGYSGLLVTSTDPESVRKKYGLAPMPVIWLSDKKKSTSCECIPPQNLDLLYYTLRDFVNTQGKVVVCLTQFDSVFHANTSQSVARFIEKLTEIAKEENSVFLIHIDPTKKHAEKVFEHLPEIFDVTKIFMKNDEITKLNAMIAAAGRKYRKREINDKVYEEIMRDYEEKLIELEVDYKELMLKTGFTILEEK